MIIVDDIEQGTPEWDKLRIANPGASSMKKIITTKGNPSSQAEAYLNLMFDEAIENRKIESYSDDWMHESLEREQESRDDWMIKNDIEIIQVALCYKDENRWYHCSPDGLMPSIEWGFETKNAMPHVQRQRLENHAKGGKNFLMDHFVQVQSSLYITGYKAWVLQSYCRNMEPLTLTVLPDWEFHKKLGAELLGFIGKLQNLIKQYKEA